MSNLSDMDYLKQDEIGKILAMGLAEVYKQTPKYPIDFFAKWLLNHENQQQQKLKELTKIKEREKKIEEIELRKQQEQELKRAEELKKKELEKKEEEFINMIKSHQFHEEILESELPEHIEKELKLSGVYIGLLDYPNQQCDIEYEDAEDAHIDKSKGHVIKYIGCSKSHQFLKGQSFSLDQGITARVFNAKAEQNEDNNDQQQQINEQNDKNTIVTEDYIYVENVVENSNIFFHKIPMLGAYIALPIVYNSSLTQQSFDNALQEREKFNQLKEEINKQREEKEAEFNEKIREMQDNGEDTTEYESQWQQQLKEWEEIKEAEIITIKRKFVLCCDTLGQDIGINQNQIEYLKNIVKVVQESWEQNEKENLFKDINNQINYLKQQEVSIQEQVDQFKLEEDQAAEERLSTLEPDLNEKQQTYELENSRWAKIVTHLQQESIKGYIINLTKFRILKYQSLLQGILIFLGYKKNQINIKGTNILDWKNVKSLINQTQFFDLIQCYNYKGAKPEAVEPYCKINRLQTRLSQFNQEEIDNYNLGLGRLLRWMNISLTLRKLDIELRRELKIKMDQERQDKIKAEEERQQQKEQAFQEHKAGLGADDLEAFNEEEWRKQFDDEYPIIQIPDIMQDDVDNDLEDS